MGGKNDAELLPDAAWRRAFRQRLTPWFERHARDLPWRRSRDPYRIWISEIMLQQTQVATVEPYFERFVAAFPDVAALAAADEEAVLQLWEGLGYYRRARQLHQAARKIVEDHAGRFPRDPESVQDLPGIGRYTAGAILSIAFDARQPILEANTVRLWSRLLAYRGEPASASGSRLLWAAAEAVLPDRNIGHFNQALMELGSLVCLPRGPRCEECPAAMLCGAFRQSLQAVIPKPKIKPRAESRREAAVVVRRRGQILLLKYPEGKRWAGLWDFPRVQLESIREEGDREELARKIQMLTGVAIELGERLTTIKHGVTRFRITLECHEATATGGRISANHCEAIRWVRPDELNDFPLSSTARKLATLIGR
jgi:A/G-specific adenine glycosylase